MKTYISFYYNNTNYYMGLLNGSDNTVLEVKDLFIIKVFKRHNHSYYFKAFFYKSKNIYYFYDYSTKSKLLDAIQNLLQVELSDV